MFSHYWLILGWTIPCLASALDMTQWMGQLTSTVLLQDVLLPGSHNAGAYQILGELVSCGSNEDLDGISEETLETLLTMEQSGSLNLVETQRVSIYEQLQLGSRYLDLRLGWYQEEIRLHHFLFMDVTFPQVLNETATFLKEHPTELVVMKLRLQCGTPLPVALELLISDLGNLYGGPLTSDILSSPINQVQGLVYVIWDETDEEAALQVESAAGEERIRSVQPDEYYRIHPCNDETTTAIARNSCGGWPDYTQDQGLRLHEAIASDSAASEGTQLADWKPFTTSHSFRILSFVGVLPFGKGCDPDNSFSLGMAIVSCDRIGIDSYTETFQAEFLDLLATLETNQMMDAMNVIQIDYVDGFSLDAIVRLNGDPNGGSQDGNTVVVPPVSAIFETVCARKLGSARHPLCIEACQQSECCWNNRTCQDNPNCQGYEICATINFSGSNSDIVSANENETDVGATEYTEDVMFDVCWNHDNLNLCAVVCEGSQCCFEDDPTESSCQEDFPCYKYDYCSALYPNATASIDQACNNMGDLADCVAACGEAYCCFTDDGEKACSFTNPGIVCSRFQACNILYGV